MYRKIAQEWSRIIPPPPPKQGWCSFFSPPQISSPCIQFLLVINYDIIFCLHNSPAKPDLRGRHLCCFMIGINRAGPSSTERDKALKCSDLKKIKAPDVFNMQSLARCIKDQLRPKMPMGMVGKQLAGSFTRSRGAFPVISLCPALMNTKHNSSNIISNFSTVCLCSCHNRFMFLKTGLNWATSLLLS